MATTLQTGNLCTIVAWKSNFSCFVDETEYVVELHSGRPISHIILQICKNNSMLETSRKKSSCSTMCPKVATRYCRLKMKILCRNRKQTMTEIQGKFTCHVASSTKLSGSLYSTSSKYYITRLKVNLYASSFTDNDYILIRLNYLYLYYERSQQCLHADNSTVRVIQTWLSYDFILHLQSITVNKTCYDIVRWWLAACSFKACNDHDML